MRCPGSCVFLSSGACAENGLLIWEGGGWGLVFNGLQTPQQCSSIAQLTLLSGLGWGGQVILPFCTWLRDRATASSTPNLRFHRARREHKTPQGQKQKKQKKITQNPPSSGGPWKHKKNYKNIRRWSISGRSRIFRVFSGPNAGGGFCNFFGFFRISGLGRFLCSVWARRKRNPSKTTKY